MVDETYHDCIRMAGVTNAAERGSFVQCGSAFG